MSDESIEPPAALVLGCNTPHGINVLSDWIEERTGHAPDFATPLPHSYPIDHQLGSIGDGFSYGDSAGDGTGLGHGEGYGMMDGNGYGGGSGYVGSGCDGDGTGNGEAFRYGNYLDGGFGAGIFVH